MHEERLASGQRLAELAELGVIEFRPEPLNAAFLSRRVFSVINLRMREPAVCPGTALGRVVGFELC